MVGRLWGPDKTPEMAKLANDGLAEVCARHPDRFVGYTAVVPMNNPEEAAKEGQRAADGGAGVLASLRGDREARKADPAASGAQPRDARLPGRDQVEIRDLQRARLAVRDRRRAVALHLLQDHGHLSEAQDRVASSRRRHSVS